MTEWLLMALAALIVVALAVDAVRSQRRDHHLRDHLERLGHAATPPATTATTATTATAGATPEVPRGRLTRRLRAAGLSWRPGVFIAATVALATLCTAVLWVRFPAVPLFAIIGAGFALYTPFAMVRAWAGWRARRFETRLVDALDFLVAALEGGQNATQALASTSEVAEEPVRTAFGEMARRIEFGMPVARAAAPVAEGYDAEGVRIFTQTLVTKLETGGPLAPVLRAVGRIIRSRLELRMQLRSQLSGAQFAAVFIALIPYALIPVYAWRKPDWVDRLLHHPMGPQLLFLAIVLQVIGFLWIRRILRMEVG